MMFLDCPMKAFTNRFSGVSVVDLIFRSDTTSGRLPPKRSASHAPDGESDDGSTAVPVLVTRSRMPTELTSVRMRARSRGRQEPDTVCFTGRVRSGTGNPRSGAPLDTRHIAFLELFNSQVQYVVPRWQRRYCWGQSDIERLVDDLVTVAQVPAGSQAAHYGGTMLTWTSVNSSRDLKDFECQHRARRARRSQQIFESLNATGQPLTESEKPG